MTYSFFRRECALTITGTALILLLLSSLPAYAIPEHEHTGPPGKDKTVTWEYESATRPNPPWGDSPHQHHCGNEFVGGHHQPYGVRGWVWDDETLLIFRNPDDTGNLMDRSYPHGFIDEKQGSAHIPDYYFKGDWSSADAQKAKQNITAAFKMWGDIQAGTSPVSGLALETGIAFEEEKAVEANAEIIIWWGSTTEYTLGDDELGVTRVFWTDRTWDKPVKVYFNTNPIKNETHKGWFFGKAVDTPDTNYHFFSTALHEVGHVLGLADQPDKRHVAPDFDDVMVGLREPGKNDPPNRGPAFDSIDAESRDGAIDLYSIPVAVTGVEYVGGIIVLVDRPASKGGNIGSTPWIVLSLSIAVVTVSAVLFKRKHRARKT